MIESKNWMKYITEAVVIVGSILLAFAIDAWWEDRSDSVRLAAAIENVIIEVAQDRAEIERAFERNQIRLDNMSRFLNLSPEAIMALPDRSIPIPSNSPSPFDPGEIALESLLNGGNLELIAGNELARALLEWAQFPNEINNDYKETVQLALLVSEMAAPYGVNIAIYNLRTGQSTSPAPTLQEAVAGLRGNLAFVDMVVRLFAFFQDFNNQLEEGLTLADKVLDASLAD